MKKEIKAEDNAKAKKFINGTSNVADLFQSMGGFNLTNQFCVDKCKVAEGSVCGEDEAFCCIGGCKEVFYLFKHLFQFFIWLINSFFLLFAFYFSYKTNSDLTFFLHLFLPLPFFDSFIYIQ